MKPMTLLFDTEDTARIEDMMHKLEMLDDLANQMYDANRLDAYNDLNHVADWMYMDLGTILFNTMAVDRLIEPELVVTFNEAMTQDLHALARQVIEGDDDAEDEISEETMFTFSQAGRLFQIAIMTNARDEYAHLSDIK